MTEVKHYRYVGSPAAAPPAGENHLGLAADVPVTLAGETALGQEIGGVFRVQVDRFAHPWSHYWHETTVGDWEETR